MIYNRSEIKLQSFPYSNIKTEDIYNFNQLLNTLHKLWGIKSKLAKKDRAPYYPCAFVCFALWPAAIY